MALLRHQSPTCLRFIKRWGGLPGLVRLTASYFSSMNMQDSVCGAGLCPRETRTLLFRWSDRLDSLEESAWGLILLYGAYHGFCCTKTLLCGWRACFCHVNADLLLGLSHAVAPTAPPRVEAGPEAPVESLSTDAGPQPPGAGVLFALCRCPFPLSPGVAGVCVPCTRSRAQTSPALCGKVCLPFPPRGSREH